MFEGFIMELDDTLCSWGGGGGVLSHNHNLRTFSTIRDMELIHRDDLGPLNES